MISNSYLLNQDFKDIVVTPALQPLHEGSVEFTLTAL